MCEHLRNEVARAGRVDGRDALVLEVVRRVAAVQAAAGARAALAHARPRHAPLALPTPAQRHTSRYTPYTYSGYNTLLY